MPNDYKYLDDLDFEGNPPAMYDEYDVPIYYGETYYNIDGMILSLESLAKFRKECEADGSTKNLL